METFRRVFARLRDLETFRRVFARTRQLFLSSLAANPNYFWSVFSLYFITFIIILPWICNDWAHSYYFSSSWKREELAQMAMDKNQERLQMAENYIARLDFAATLQGYESMLDVDDVDIAIGVITVRRQYGKRDIGYLTQVMARFDELFKQDRKFAKKALFICNVHAGPGHHREADKLSLYFPVMSRFPDGDTASVIMDNFEKEKQDYMYCLEEGMNYRPRYVMIVEDDTLPRYDMLSVLKHALDHSVENSWHAGHLNSNNDNWAYFKLYYPEKWQGYASEPLRVLELFAMCAVSGAVSLSALLLSRTRRYNKYSYPIRTHYMAFILGALYMMLLAVSVGRQYMLEFRRMSAELYSVTTAPSCCSPSILYPSRAIPDILDNLHNVKCSSYNPVDIAIDSFVVGRGYDKYLIEPNLFNHVGYISTLKGPSRNPALFVH